MQGKDSRGRYGYWTNYVYRSLFGMDAATMKETWTYSVHENSRIARNDLGAIAMGRYLTVAQNFSRFIKYLH